MRGLLIFVLTVTVSNAWATGAPVRIDDGDTITPQADITVTSSIAVLIKASNANRAALNCTVSEPVRWGNAGLTNTTGQFIAADSSVAIRNTGPIYMIAELTTAIVSCTEESYSSSSGPIFSP